MPNTKSAERRMRGNARKQARNTTVKSRLSTLEKKYVDVSASGKKDEAATALRTLVSALDKAAKTGVVKKGTVDRKKSRLTIRLAKIKAA